MSLPNGIFNETYKIYEILDAEKKDFNQALTDVGISPAKYITPDQLTAKKGKNIIVISIESLEQGFLGKNFDNITPNLSKLSKKWTFYDQMPQSIGGSWTSGSMYSYQVGIPAFFKGQSNTFFQGTKDVKLIGLGHILNKAGYNSKYIAGDLEFAGMSDILSAYDILVVSQDNALGQYPKITGDIENIKNNGWSIGLHDHDLFKEAKLQIKEFKKDDNKPFALFLQTINTHYPNGIYDERMEQLISKKDNNLEFSVAAIDYLVNDFLLYLKKYNLLENTAIYIFPDHLLMGNSGSVLEKLRKSKRQLYLLTNVEENKLSKQTSDTIYQIDLPRMIIDGAEIKTNAKFLVDFIDNKDIQNFLIKNRVKLTTLNSASVIRENYQEGININVRNNNLVIDADGNIFNTPLSSQNEIYDMTFNSDMVLIKKEWKKNLYNTFKPHEDDKNFRKLHISIFFKEKNIEKVCFGNLQTVGICKYGTEIIFTKDEIKTITNNNITTISYLYNSYIAGTIEIFEHVISKQLSNLYNLIENLNENKNYNIISANEYIKDKNRFIAHAGGQINNHKYTNSLESMNLSYKKGFRLFELDIIKTLDNIYVAAHDWKYWAKITGYKGVLPPNRKTFKEQKIYGKYTSMDINDINKWFKNHPDAILVTDKVNTPLDFSKIFIDKNRLMMELFTWDAVKEGINAKIKSSMPTGVILDNIKGNKITYLKELGITDIASSRRIINKQKTLVNDIVNAGINIYAFHLYFDKGKNEKYVVCKERNYFYGMYADSIMA